MRKSNVKNLTIGAMFAAIYGVLLLSIRYIFVDSDSIIYYIIPAPIAIYVMWKDYKNGLLVFLTSAIISFLIIDPYRALMLYVPNLILGFLIGLCGRRLSFSYTIIISFIASLGVDILSIYAFEVISGVPYIDTILNEFNSIFESINLNPDIIYNIATIALAITLVVDSIVKTIFVYIIVRILLIRLKITNAPISINLNPNKAVTLVSLLVTIVSITMTIFGLINLNAFFRVLMIIILSLMISIDLYIVSIFIITIGRKLKANNKVGLAIIIMLLGLLLAPISYVVAIIYNLTRRNMVRY